MDLSPGMSTENRFGARAVVVPIVLGVIALVVYAAPGLGEALEYQRNSILGGEFWRALTGHWTHGSIDHLAWDVFAFLALGCAIAARSSRLFAWTVGLSAVSISTFLLLFAPQWERYRGLSGIDSALFVALAIHLWKDPARSRARWVASLALGLFVLKITAEAALGRALFANDTPGYTVVSSAHLVGALAGVAAALWISQANERKPDTE